MIQRFITVAVLLYFLAGSTITILIRAEHHHRCITVPPVTQISIMLLWPAVAVMEILTQDQRKYSVCYPSRVNPLKL